MGPFLLYSFTAPLFHVTPFLLNLFALVRPFFLFFTSPPFLFLPVCLSAAQKDGHSPIIKPRPKLCMCNVSLLAQINESKCCVCIHTAPGLQLFFLNFPFRSFCLRQMISPVSLCDPEVLSSYPHLLLSRSQVSAPPPAVDVPHCGPRAWISY